MALKAEEIPELLFWFLLSGVAIYATSLVVGKVGEKIKLIFEQ